MCDREQHAAVKRTLPFSPKNLDCENLTEMAICSEEDVLNCTFESCDTEGKGEVYVSRIIAYLEDVTGQSCEKGQLRMLHKMLNPEERDVAVNLGGRSDEERDVDRRAIQSRATEEALQQPGEHLDREPLQNIQHADPTLDVL
ncbi:uncharacterized protein LOC144611363 [Rhinoraja longicauda]